MLTHNNFNTHVLIHTAVYTYKYYTDVCLTQHAQTRTRWQVENIFHSYYNAFSTFFTVVHVLGTGTCTWQMAVSSLIFRKTKTNPKIDIDMGMWKPPKIFCFIIFCLFSKSEKNYSNIFLSCFFVKMCINV